MTDSTWWYGVALPPALELLGFGGLAALRAVGGADPVRANVPVALGLAFAVLVALLLIPVFALSLFLDARAARDDAGPWSPNPWLWGAAGLLLPVVGLVAASTSLMPLVGVAYLWRRFGRGGTVPDPDALDAASWDGSDDDRAGVDRTGNDRAGDGSDRDAVGDDAAATEVDSAPDTEPERPISRWWYGVAGTVLLYVLLAAVAALVTGPFNPETVVPGSPAAAAGFVGSLYLVVAILLLFVTAPVFSACLWLDARRLRRAGAWRPNRLLVGALAVGHLATMVVSLAMLVTVPAAIGYLLLRRRRVGLFA